MFNKSTFLSVKKLPNGPDDLFLAEAHFDTGFDSSTVFLLFNAPLDRVLNKELN